MPDQDLFLQRALLEEGLLDNEQLDAARRHCAEHGVDLVEALVRTETLSSRQIALIKADVCEAPFVALADYEPCYANTALVPRATAERYCAYPLFMIDGVLTLDTSLSYQVGRAQVRLHLHNLTDADYETRGFGNASVIPADPIGASAGVEWQL